MPEMERRDGPVFEHIDAARSDTGQALYVSTMYIKRSSFLKFKPLRVRVLSVKTQRLLTNAGSSIFT